MQWEKVFYGLFEIAIHNIKILYEEGKQNKLTGMLQYKMAIAYQLIKICRSQIRVENTCKTFKACNIVLGKLFFELFYLYINFYFNWNVNFVYSTSNFLFWVFECLIPVKHCVLFNFFYFPFKEERVFRLDFTTTNKIKKCRFCILLQTLILPNTAHYNSIFLNFSTHTSPKN